jgi:hypothetical protein
MTMKKTLMTSVLVLSGLLAVPVAALAAEGGASKDDAVAMVKKGVARIKSGGAETAYAEFNDKANQTYRDRDLYLVVYGLDGVVLSHGANIDGKAFVRERVEMGKKNASFWQDYKFTNPENKKIEPKSMYCERLNESVVCGGIYK